MRRVSKRELLRSLVRFGGKWLRLALPIWAAGCNQESKSAQQPSVRKSGIRPPALDPEFEPAYLRLHNTRELRRRGEELWRVMEDCRLCPRECGANRLKGEKGFCGASSALHIASHHPHFGEEQPLVGKGGSGTVFFSHCSLRCVFCINWEISQGGHGHTRSLEQLARMMLDLQNQGCHNLNVVTPTHYSAHIVLALDLAASQGFRLPLVYNTCGWERVAILRQLDGIVDIYLPDFKYAGSNMAGKYSSGPRLIRRSPRPP